VMRGLPLIMLIFWVYFFLPAIVGRPVSGFSTLLATLVIYEAAYLAEIVRAGIESLPQGQMEAARAVGLTYMQAMRKVVLPQALYNMVPAMLSQFASTIKETSLGYVISVNELTYAANQVNSALLTKPFPVFAVLAAIYFLLCFSLTQAARILERRVARRRAGIAAAAGTAPVIPPPIAAIAE
jgi:polar amino acid transport system permease protein